MRPIRTLGRLAVLALTATALSACITVFPKTKPAQLYRFGGEDVAEASRPSSSRVGFIRTPGGFNTAAAGDRILTVNGAALSYLSDTRWAEPAALLFEEAVNRAFSTSTGPARLMGRGDPGRAAYFLRLDVQRFEAVYDKGPKSAPEVRMDIHAVVVRASDRTLAREETIAIALRAPDNRVAAIVSTFDAAAGQAIDKIVALADQAATAP